MGFVRASLCGDRGTRSACGANVGGAIWISAGDVVANCRGGAGGLRAGFCNFVLLDTPRWEIAGRNGPRGSEQAGRVHRAARGAGNSGDFAGGGRVGRGERAEVFSVGDVYVGDDHTHRHATWRVSAIFAAWPSSGSVADR